MRVAGFSDITSFYFSIARSLTERKKLMEANCSYISDTCPLGRTDNARAHMN